MPESGEGLVNLCPLIILTVAEGIEVTLNVIVGGLRPSRKMIQDEAPFIIDKLGTHCSGQEEESKETWD